MSDWQDEWEVVALGDVAEIINGRAYKLSEWETSGTPVIRLQNLTQRGGDFYFSNLALPEKQYCTKGDLLYMWSATFGPHIWWGEKAIFHYHIWKIEPNERIDRKFLFYLLDAKTQEWKTAGSGMAMIHLTKAGIEKELLCVPPLPEQKKIAEILSGIDLLIQETKAKVNKLKEIRNALIQNLHMESSGEWVTLSEISDFITSGSRGWSQYYSDTGSRFVRIGNLSRNSIDLDPAPEKWQLVAPPEGAEGARTKLEEGDILISITADLGICGIYSAAIGEAYINQHIALVRVGPRHIGCSRQIAYYICSEHCQEQIRSMNDSGAKAGLNLDSIRKISVPLIKGGANNRVVRSIDALQSAISGNHLRLQHLAYEKSSLASDLLSGRKRVSV